MPRPLSSPIMDDEDALREQVESLIAMADGAIATAKEQQARAQKLRAAVSEALLAVAQRESGRAARLLETVLDETMPQTD